MFVVIVLAVVTVSVLGIAIGSARLDGASIRRDSVLVLAELLRTKRGAVQAIRARTPEAYSIDRIPPYGRIRCPHHK